MISYPFNPHFFNFDPCIAFGIPSINFLIKQFKRKKEKGEKILEIITATLFQDRLPHLDHFRKKQN